MTASIKKVYVLQHEYQRPDGCDDAKFIGVYSSQELAEMAIARLRAQPGFRQHPNEFCVSGYELDMDHWTEGFVSAEEASKSR
jgi:homoserine kinase type II